MPLSHDAREIVDAIKGQTRELKKLRESIEKMGKTSREVDFNFSGDSPVPLDLDTPEHDYTSEDVEKHFPDHR
jgi:hypothetical protein